MIYDTNDMILCFVLGHSRLENLTAQGMSRLNSVFRPSTQAAYTSMFLAFYGYMGVAMVDVHVGVLLAFLESLHVNKVTTTNKSVKINRPLCITKCNISIEDLYTMVACCDFLIRGKFTKLYFLYHSLAFQAFQFMSSFLQNL